MARLTPCPSCHAHVLVGDRACPHCGALLRSTAAPRVATLAVGLTLASCIMAEPAYGLPDPSTSGTGGTAGTTGSTEGATDGMTEGMTTTASTGAESGGTDTGGTDTGGTTADGSSGPEPDYGVATTSG
ncbi:hypothetical protein [Paraliomyxa miuraensis]|uniref:hypothetical protein n=1 Tax=Paraliomyxa miuraensis TaxID=376150 RepID=UPI00224DF533|nr:hypothetical protein [Paraliomyxa miuraensis]MCX4241565.1 hypothetical protein [Paraliomyxa miuraensis]